MKNKSLILITVIALAALGSHEVCASASPKNTKTVAKPVTQGLKDAVVALVPAKTQTDIGTTFHKALPVTDVRNLVLEYYGPEWLNYKNLITYRQGLAFYQSGSFAPMKTLAFNEDNTELTIYLHHWTKTHKTAQQGERPSQFLTACIKDGGIWFYYEKVKELRAYEHSVCLYSALQKEITEESSNKSFRALATNDNWDDLKYHEILTSPPAYLYYNVNKHSKDNTEKCRLNKPNIVVQVNKQALLKTILATHNMPQGN